MKPGAAQLALRERMRRLRAKRRRLKQCRACTDPAVTCPRTGRLLQMCQAHLDADRDRQRERRAA